MVVSSFCSTRAATPVTVAVRSVLSVDWSLISPKRMVSGLAAVMSMGVKAVV